MTITGTDASGNSSSGFITLIVEDTEAPVIACPNDISVNNCSEVDYAIPTATDNCDQPILTLIGGLESGSIFPNGTTTVEWEATDLSNNIGTCSFEVFVDYDFQLTNALLTNPTCAGAMDGNIDIFIEGGLEPYQTIWSHGGGPTNLMAGEYSVTITDSNGCEVSASFELQDPTAISIDLIEIVPAMSGNATGSIQISVIGGDPPIIVEWYENGVILPDFDPFLAPPGSYTVLVTDYNGCITEAGPFIVDNLNSIVPKEFNTKIKLYPNPTDGIVTFEFTDPLSQTANISVFDITGKVWLVDFIVTTDKSDSIDLTQFSKGVYWVKIVSNNQLGLEKTGHFLIFKIESFNIQKTVLA